MGELVIGVIGGLLVAALIAAWARFVMGPSYVSNEAALWPDWLKKLVPDCDSVVLIPLHKREEYKAKGFRAVKRWILREIRTESANGDHLYLRRPKAG